MPSRLQETAEVIRNRLTASGQPFSEEIIMVVKLTPSCVLTTEHGKSLLNMPVLVNLRTQEAYNPTDGSGTYSSLMTA
jgi:hypothetical protein